MKRVLTYQKRSNLLREWVARHQGCLGRQVLQAAQHATPKIRLRLVGREASGGETSADGACLRLVMGRMVFWEMRVSV